MLQTIILILGSLSLSFSAYPLYLVICTISVMGLTAHLTTEDKTYQNDPTMGGIEGGAHSTVSEILKTLYSFKMLIPYF